MPESIVSAAPEKESSLDAPEVVMPQEEKTKSTSKAPAALKVPKAELTLLTLIGQREKLCRDDLTAMLLSGEESLKMLIKEPSE